MIDRQDELERLRRAATEAPQLVVMRGRRRVGKSYLLDRSYADHRLVYFQADEGEARGHLDLLAAELGRLVNAPIAFGDWNEALGTLGEQAKLQPLVVVLDEFQWMLLAEPTLDSIVMRHFDRWERARVPITLVVSGSALTMIEQLLEGDRAMFGRSGYRPFLQPFDYRDAALFVPNTSSAAQKLLRYGVLGGTAQYQVWAGHAPIREILKRRILAKDEPLFEEPLQLIRGESAIREPGNYYEVLRVIARGATQFNEILQRSKISSGQLLTNRLDRLAKLRYIEQRQPLGGNGSASWSVSDPFFRFWFRYVYPNRSRLQRGRVDEVCEAILADIDNHMGGVRAGLPRLGRTLQRRLTAGRRGGHRRVLDPHARRRDRPRRARTRRHRRGRVMQVVLTGRRARPRSPDRAARPDPRCWRCRAVCVRARLPQEPRAARRARWRAPRVR